jgi:hypothetical protein
VLFYFHDSAIREDSGMRVRPGLPGFGKIIVCSLLGFALAAPCLAAGASPRDALLAGFQDPPQAARPRVWWHWMNGNVTKQGIKADIAWMHRIGIAGMNAIDATISTPQVVKKRLVYMSPAWDDAFRYAARLADRYSMELSIDSSPGWSMTGGPWVSPQQAMKKMVWSATAVDGGKPFHGMLAEPPSTPGPFQNVPVPEDSDQYSHTAPNFYRDSIVIAYRTPVEAPAVADAASNAGTIDKAALSNGDLTHFTTLTPLGEGQDVWIEIDFGKPVQIQGLSLAVSVTKGLGYATEVQASDDGTAWRNVADMPQAAQLERFKLRQQTLSFAPATARYFRVVLSPAEPLPTSLRPHVFAPGAMGSEPPSGPPPARAYKLYQLVFHAKATVNDFEQKAMYAIPPLDFYAAASPADFAPGTAIDPKSVVVLSDRMKPDGTLDWTPPSGQWTVLRIGYSLTATQNHPATPEAAGLEVDKLDAAAVRAYMEHYLDTYARVVGPKLFGKHGLQAFVVDSAEIGEQNWTGDVLSEFEKIKGYDPAPFLPALTGAVVQSPEASDKFLWDWRDTIDRLFAQNHYGTIGAVARERGLINYGEALEDHRPGFGDDMAMRQYATIPMGAMWTYGEKYPTALTYEADLLGAASVAHIYGQNYVGAESLTSAGQPWAYAPRELKPFVDMEFARGVNRIVIHTSVHQPVDRPPGLSLFGYGQFFNRLETWAGDAKPWIDYLARCSYLLQQGRFVADVAYFYGQEAPITGLYGKTRVNDVPDGYAFDFVDEDALEHRLSVDRGLVATASGMRYRVLYLGGSSRFMTLGVLKRLGDLVAQGAVLVGKRPEASPSLADDPAAFAALADELFGNAPHAYGKGEVFPSGSLAEAFAALQLPPDFAYTKPEPDTEILYNHRRLDRDELYFVSNRRDRAENVTVTLRATGYAPEIWNPVTGQRAPADFATADGRTKLVLALPVYGSIFVVLRQKANAASRTTAPAATTALKKLDGPWTVAFQAHRGAPARIVLPELTSWSGSAVDGVKYFSGTGTYTKTFTLPARRGGRRLFLDLGDVRELARVTLNGKRLGIVWTEPFLLDITKAMRPGKNVLNVEVTNLWVDRLIGDEQSDSGKKYTFTTIPTYRADAPLRESGLLGPVEIRQAATIDRR